MDFMQEMCARAAKTPQRICFPESESPDVLACAAEVVKVGMGTPVLVGAEDVVRAAAAAAGVSVDGFEYIDHTNEAVREELADAYTAQSDAYSKKAIMRKTKDAVNCAMVLLRLGRVDCVAAGKERSTGDVVFAATSFVGLAEGVESPSSMGIADIPGFEGPEGTYLGIADCAITAQPDAADLAGIAIASADTARTLLGWEPRVALLSFSTFGSAEHETIDVIRDAVARVHELRPDILCDGELQLDAAILPEVAAHKAKRPSEVAGRANIVIFPNLHAGNIGVKLIQIFGHANAYGPVLQGFARPVCDFSRSAPVSEMLGNVAMLVIRSAAQKGADAA